MRTYDYTNMTDYAGETFPQPSGTRKVYTGISNGPISILVDGKLYDYCAGGHFAFCVAATSDILVHFAAPKGVQMSLIGEVPATVQVGDAASTWTKDEPRPAVNPQMAAMMHSIKALEHRLAAQTAMATGAVSALEAVEHVLEGDTPEKTETATEEPDTGSTDDPDA